jgi:hypothetical protein
MESFLDSRYGRFGFLEIDHPAELSDGRTVAYAC